MNTTTMLLLDADVFIAAKNRYYAFDICPGFWKSLVHLKIQFQWDAVQ